MAGPSSPSEFRRLFPLDGYALLAYSGKRHIEDVDPQEIFLAGFYGARREFAGFTTREVDRRLEERHRAAGAAATFSGLTNARFAAEELASAWTRSHPASQIIPASVEQPYVHPLRDSALFRAFGAMEPSAEAILEFADQHGDLMDNCPLLVWQEEILAMQRALRVWDLLRAGDLATLKHYFHIRRWTEELHSSLPAFHQKILSRIYRKSYIAFDSHPEAVTPRPPRYPIRRATEPIAWPHLPNDELDALINEIDVKLIAKAYLWQVLNQRSALYFNPRFVWEEPLTLARILVPTNLLGGLWLQFEQSITGKTDYRNCLGPGCCKPFELSPGVSRSDRKYCSDLCRVRASQLRKKQALELWAKDHGPPIEEIARELDVDVETVMGWVAKHLWAKGKGLSVKEIAKELEVEVKKVKVWISKRKEK
jgi:hypothetical protein